MKMSVSFMAFECAQTCSWTIFPWVFHVSRFRLY